MEDTYKQAFSEVLEVLKHSSESIKSKIPKTFMDFLNENKDNDYDVNINFNDKNWEDSVKDETQAILAMVYRDYIVSDEQRKKLIEVETQEQKKIEQDLSEKYSYDNLFNKTKNIEETEIKSTTENMQIVEYKKEGFLTRILNKLKNFFKKS